MNENIYRGTRIQIHITHGKGAEMSKEKQIEEMAQDICEWYRHGICSLDDKECDLQCTKGSIVEKLVNRGYRKQKEGEWKKLYDKAPRYVCTICNHLFNNKEYKYCPNCGARMKG